MVRIYCSVADCWEPSGGMLSKHRFPNPKKYEDLFNKWVTICANKKLYENGVTPERIYQNCRVCSKHFSISDFARNNVLKKGALPSKYVPMKIIETTGNVDEESYEIQDHTYAKTQIANNFIDEQAQVPVGTITGEQRNDLWEHTYSKTQNAIISEISDSNTGEEEHGSWDHTYTKNQNAYNDASHIDGSGNLTEQSDVVSEDHSIMNNNGGTGLLAEVNVARCEQLTPKAKHFYRKASYFKRRAIAAKKSKLSLKKRLQEADKFTKSEMFDKVTSCMDQIKTRFMKMQLDNCIKKPKGRRYTLEDKVLALAMYKQCGNGYKLMSKIFALPSRNTVMRLLNRIPLQPGFCESVFDVIRVEANLFKDPREKYCFLIFDEMSIKPGLNWNYCTGNVEGLEDFGYKRTNNIADHAQVFMLRGIMKNWKQPIFYNFTGGATKSHDIARIIKLIIKKCTEAGLKVVATICDQGSNNVKAIKTLINDTKAKYLRQNLTVLDKNECFEVGNQKIVPLFDVPHLIKGIRNNFMKYNMKFCIEGKQMIGKWEHVMKAYKMDSYLGSLRLMPKLTDRHVNPIGSNKMKVSLCTQVMSRTVAVAINVMSCQGKEVQSEEGNLKMDESGKETATFLEFIDDLFDSVNGSSKNYDNFKPLKGPVNDKSKHFTFWRKALSVLASMKCIKQDGSHKIPPSVKNFRRTLKNFKVLYENLKQVGFVYLMPRMFNQDPLENFFGQIRQRGARYNTPTASAFTTFFKSLLVKGLTTHSLGSNCEDDKTDLFITLKNFITQGVSEPDEDLDENLTYPRTSHQLNTIEQQAVKYVCGYLLRKAQTVYKTCTCAEAILEKKRVDAKDDSDLFTKLKEYKFCNLKYSSSFFFLQICKALNIIKNILNHHLHKKGVFIVIMQILLKEINFTQCEHNKAIKEVVFKKLLKTVGHDFLKQLNRILTCSKRVGKNENENNFKHGDFPPYNTIIRVIIHLELHESQIRTI